jgi:hypothetical protein
MNQKLIDAIEQHKSARKAKHDADMAYMQSLSTLEDALQDCGISLDEFSDHLGKSADGAIATVRLPKMKVAAA